MSREFDTPANTRLGVDGYPAEKYSDLIEASAMELHPDMTIREATDIMEASEAHIWDEGFFDGIIMNKSYSFDGAKKTTLRESSPQEQFVVCAMVGSNEGIYLHVEGMGKDGLRNQIISAKSIMEPDSEHWEKCWQSAGRISFALNQMYW